MADDAVDKVDEEVAERSTLSQEIVDYMLPGGWIAEHMRWACKTTHAPPLFHLVASLGYAAFELARRSWWLEGVATSYKAPALWIACIADSGEGKGAAIKRVRLLDELVYAALPFTFKDGRTEGEGALFTVRGSPAGTLTDLESRVYPDGKGDERTAAFLVNDEFETVLDQVKRNPDFGPVLIEAHDQTTLRFRQRNIQKDDDGDRRGLIPNPAFSTMFVSTKQMLNEVYSEKLLYGGFSGRFLWIHPRNWDVFWANEPSIRMDEAKQVAASVAAWIERIGGDRDQDSRKIVFPRTGPVAAAHEEWALWLHDNHPRGSPSRGLYVPRLANTTAVMACVIAAVESTSATEIVTVSIEHYQKARNLAIEAYHSVPTLESLLRTAEARADDKLLAAIRTAGRAGMALRDLAAHINKPLERIYPLLKTAKELGLIVELHMLGLTGTKGKQGRVWDTHYAPHPSLRRVLASGAEGIEQADYTRWAQGLEAEEILALRPQLVKPS